MHIGENGKESKTEAIVFKATGTNYNNYDTSTVEVGIGYITYINAFKYLGSIISHDLSDASDIENCITQSRKALNTLIPH
eukprot:996269-Ditylum_brightwellii.AAC.1